MATSVGVTGSSFIGDTIEGMFNNAAGSIFIDVLGVGSLTVTAFGVLTALSQLADKVRLSCSRV